MTHNNMTNTININKKTKNDRQHTTDGNMTNKNMTNQTDKPTNKTNNKHDKQKNDKHKCQTQNDQQQ